MRRIWKSFKALVRAPFSRRKSKAPPSVPRPVTVILPRDRHQVSRKGIDPDALKILYRLRRFNHTAYLVGGGVRDLLLGLPVKDFDISTSAQPNELRKIFANCRLVGRRFRLAHILFRGKFIEVSTFRKGSDYDLAEGEDLLIRSDNTFGTPEEDAFRRDFTINGLFYSIEDFSVIDHVGGLADLERRVIRTIGDPNVRLREDPIRMLRAVRLAARLDFQIDPETLAAIGDHRAEIWKGATPRILEELHRMLREGASRRSFVLLMETGLLDMLLPELSAHLADRRRAADFWGHLDALDHLKAGGHEFSMPVLISVVAYQDFRAGLEQGGDRADLHTLAEESLGPMARRLEIPKRHVDRAHAILLSQRRFTAAKRKGFQPGAFAGRPHFPETLDLFHIHAVANQDLMPVFDRWLQYRRTEGPEEILGEAPKRRPRRRRRGGRKDAQAG